MKQDPRGPRDFYAPPQSGPKGPDTAWRLVTYALAPLYLALVVGTLLSGYAAVAGELAVKSGQGPKPGWVEPAVQVCFFGSILVGWLLSVAAFLVRRHEKTPILGAFVLLSGLASAGFLALVSLPIAGNPGDSGRSDPEPAGEGL